MRTFLAIFLGALLVVSVASCGDQSVRTPGSPEKAEDPDPTLGEDAELTSDEPATPEPPPGAVPDYEVTREQDRAEGPYAVANYTVATDATSERDLRAITVELRAESPGKEAVLVNFYPDEPDADLSGTGGAFVDGQAASVILGSAYTRKDVEEIMDDDGLLVVTAAGGEETTE